ncbi:hypothetical protein T03_5693 [Trichinella britovi]|uniref:Uncharacterized protein n=1 Tax=Trichinella britovi TaxID=45882 RepID=A0A0V1CDN9_TRIBR|nr:hypothetical protein T03_5693 [Trichinella britovi]
MCDLAFAPTRDGVDRQFQSPLCIAHQPCCDQSPHDLQPWETQPLYRVNADFRGDQIHPRVWSGGIEFDTLHYYSSNFLVASPFILGNRILFSYRFKIYQLIVLEHSVWLPARGTKM